MLKLLKFLLLPVLFVIWSVRWWFAAWTTPDTRVAGDVLSAANYNTYIRDNLNYLLSGRPIGSVRYVGGDKTTATAPYVAVDSTNVKTTITVVSGRVEVHVTCTAAKTSGTIAGTLSLGIDVDGTNYPMLDASMFPINALIPLHFTFVITGLSVGSHTFTLTWGSSLDTMTMYGSAARPISLIAREI